MITISVERGLVRLKSWDDMLETPGFERDIDPKNVRLKEIIGVYAFDTKQPCGLKNCRQPHGNGYLVTTTNGQVTNLGSVCGKNNFSVTFTQLRNTFDRDFRAKERRERLEMLKSRLPGILSRTDSIKTEVTPFYAAIRHISGKSGSLPQAIVNAVRNMRRSGDGAITMTRKATNEERDLAIATGNAREGTPFYVTQTVGRLSNIGAIASAEAIRTTLQELEPELRRLQSSDVETLSDKEARHIDKLTGGLDSRLDELQLAADSLKIFATQQNLSQLMVLVDSQTDKRLLKALLDTLPST